MYVAVKKKKLVEASNKNKPRIGDRSVFGELLLKAGLVLGNGCSHNEISESCSDNKS